MTSTPTPLSSLTPHVASETGWLQHVIVHTPGEEMGYVSPSNLDALLFEDILHVEDARDEHQLMCQVFETIVGRPEAVLQISRLLLESFQTKAARHTFVEHLCEISKELNLLAYAEALKSLDANALHRFALTGESELSILAQPIPNLLFTRDLAAVVNDAIIISHPATTARARESIIIRTILEHHPLFANIQDKIIRLPSGVTFEGGDLLVLTPEAALIGHSERTSYGGVVHVVQALFERTTIEKVIMVDLPKQRACMHLDTIFTFISPEECVVYPPLIEHNKAGHVIQFTPGNGDGTFNTTLLSSLKEGLEDTLGRSLTFIPCGGKDPLNQEREQWTDGANFFAIGPGLVIGYERNVRTFEVLNQHGYRVVSAEGFLSYHQESTFTPGEKIAIKLAGNELSRGRGGARCMTMPIVRLPSTHPHQKPHEPLPPARA